MSEDRPSQVDREQARLKLQLINHLLDSDPHNPELWFQKAFYFREAMVGTIPKRVLLERVLLWYQQCIRLRPDKWVQYHNYASTARELNRHEEALEFSIKAVSLQPSNRYAQQLLIQTLTRLGMYGEAAEAFKEAEARGCSLNPELLGSNVAGDRISTESDANDLFPAPAAIGDIYRNPNAAIEKILKGEVPAVFEAADPELFVLQFEVDELMCLGLFREAEEVCINFELTNGANSLTQSYFYRLLISKTTGDAADEPDISAAYPLLEIVLKHHSFEYLVLVDRIFKEGGVGRFITPEDVNEFDEQTQWHLSQLGDPEFNINDPVAAVAQMRPELRRTWDMAVANFIVARKLGRPLLVAYTATTLASFYDLIGESNLPFILYKIAAAGAGEAGQSNYLVNAQGKCAMILMEKNHFGSAIAHLEKGLSHADALIPLNQFHLYTTLATCYSNLSDFEKAKTYYGKAQAVQGLPETLLEQARLSLLGIDTIAGWHVVETGFPPVVCQGLEVKPHSVNTSRGPLTLFCTSEHELYDSLLQAFDNVYRIRQSLLEREWGYEYFQGYSGLMDALVRVSLDLGLNGNALMHLEAQKSIILNNRLKHLLREKPADLPDSLWEELQRLVSIHRRMVEKTEAAENSISELFDHTPADVASAIGRVLWKCRHISSVSTKRIEQKLAYGRFPRRIECAKPEQTLILEFCQGACFIVRPDDPQNPEVVRLPEATDQESVRLANRLFGIVREWLEHFSNSPSLAACPPQDQFDSFLKRLDEVFYQPLAARLDELAVENVCIIPHRVLHVLPLNLLGMSTHPKGGLGERFAVSFAPSLTCLQSLGDQPARRPENILIAANPVPRCPPGVCRNPDHDCFSMSGAERESRALSRLLEGMGFSSTALCGAEVTIDNISARLGSADVVHFATHGIFNDDRPENSGLLLSVAKGGAGGRREYLGHDCRLTNQFLPSVVGELFTLDYIWKNIDMLRCQLLNLSACSMGMVDWRERSDEFYGIANGFLYAGVQNILSNLWPVHDSASEVFNSQYYEELLAPNRTAITALKNTIHRFKAFDSGGRKPFAHPLFWAGCRVIGFS